MKKLNYLLVLAICLVFISCGGKSGEKNDEKEADLSQATASDCLISDLEGVTYNSEGIASIYGKNIVKEGSKELFTGIAIQKDQSDSIIRKVEINKGWLIRDIIKEKINGKYLTISDLNYENTEISNGYELKIADEDSYKKGFRNIEECKEYKNGKEYNTWACWINPEINQIRYKWDYKEGISGAKLTPSGCMKDYYHDSYFGVYNIYFTENESTEEYNRILEGLKKELPHFDYWIEK
jgi:hypothetical protein